MQNNKNILMYVPYVVVLAFGTTSHIICGQMCSLVTCFNVFVQQKTSRTQNDHRWLVFAIFGCDGMCFDALPDVFRTLCSLSPVFTVVLFGFC